MPKEALFDYASTAVTRVLRGSSRDENATFRSFCEALAIPIAFAAPAKANEKGGVEGANHYVQDNFFTPVPAFNSVVDLNAALAAWCEGDQMREHSSHRETIATRFAREEAALRTLPQPLPRPCVVRPAHINTISEITLDTNRYSVPTQYAHRHAFFEVYDSRLRIIVGDAVVAGQALQEARPWRASANASVATRRLIDDVRSGALDREVVDSLHAATSFGSGYRETRETAAPLSLHELEVLRRISFGHSNKETAEHLGISPATVRTHVESIFRKLGCTSRAAATLKASIAGLL